MLFDRDRALEFIQDPQLKYSMLKLVDKIGIVTKSHEVRHTDFLTPYEQKTAYRILDSILDIAYFPNGGYCNAERKMIVIYPEYLYSESITSPLAALEIKNNSSFQQLSHRDYLGSILGLGIKREKIGDVIVCENVCQVIIHKELKDYILMNLTKIGNVSVSKKEISLDMIKSPEQKYREIVGTVASLRLDSIISLGFRISRTEAQQLISRDKVSVDWETIKKSSYELEEKSHVSVKGKGRITIAAINGRTRSDRINIVLHRLI